MKYLASISRRSSLTEFSSRRLLVSVALAVLAAGFGILLSHSIGTVGAYALLLPAVVFAAWYGGLWSFLASQTVGAGLVLSFTRHSGPLPIFLADLSFFAGFIIFASILTSMLLTVEWSLATRRSSKRLERVVQATHDSFWDWDLESGHVWRGGKLSAIYGVSPEKIEPTTSWWLSRVHPHDQERVWTSLNAAISSGEDIWREEYRLRRENDDYITVAEQGVIMRDRNGTAIRVTGGTVDVSAQRRIEERLVHNAFHDPLTGLPNRELFLDRLDRALSRLGAQTKSDEAHGSSVAVLFLDVDRFKVVNDSLGHAVGDELLTALSSRLTRHLRQQDTAARFGGDEFTVLLDGLESPDDALHVADRIQQSLSIPFSMGSQQVTVSASIGLAFASSHLERPDEIVRQADLAMYRAKAAGRARSQMFEPAFDVHARSLLQRESELRQSFHDGSLQLFYQPIVSLDNARTVSFEALLRWRHPTRGLVLPSEILPIAEEAGLAIQLGKWVLQQSCQQLRVWRDKNLASSGLSISFNLSGRELMRPTLLDEVTRLLGENRLEGSSILIELTETIIMEGDAVAIRTLTQLRDLGVRLALDDFGRGHSSLGRLQDFPISMLKIDSSFVGQIGGPKQKILDAIVALAHELEIEVTAEGVETLNQLHYLMQCGASRVQGLLFSDAMAVAAAEDLLSSKAYWQVIGHPVGRFSRMTAR